MIRFLTLLVGISLLWTSSLNSGETCVVLLTGNGLKDTNSAAKNIILPERAINSLDEIS